MNSVERVKEYEQLAQEAPEVIPESRPPPNWPSEGKVEFKNYCLRYREGELVLKHVNLEVDAQDKIGIVGRTGAGKSTLMQALFRMVEPAEGTIFIDGVDITKIGLKGIVNESQNIRKQIYDVFPIFSKKVKLIFLYRFKISSQYHSSRTYSLHWNNSLQY
jgi:ABC-type multidrug transport system fused ATPase/permease subunit